MDNNEQAPDLIEEKREVPIKWHNYLFEKIKRTLFQTSNTVLGIDQIPPKIIQ